MRPIHLKLAVSRTDKGMTPNYRVYEGGGQITVKNGRGESVIKNVIMGGNGTIYVAKEVADENEVVLITKKEYDVLTRLKQEFDQPPGRQYASSTKKGRK